MPKRSPLKKIVKTITKEKRRKNAKLMANVKRAMAQPKRQKARGGLGVSSLPVRHAPPKMQLQTKEMGQVQRVSGTEFVTTVTAVSGALLPGGILFSKTNVCDPLATRLERLAEIYERWRVHKLTYHFIPTLASTFSGTLIMAQEPDVTATYDSPTTNLQRLMSLKGNCVFQVWERAAVPISPARDFTSLWTFDNSLSGDRLVEAGTMIMACVAAGTMTSNLQIGSIELEYDFEFYSLRNSENTATDQPPWLGFDGTNFSSLLTTYGPPIVNGLMSLFSSAATGGSYPAYAPLLKVARDFIAWAIPSPRAALGYTPVLRGSSKIAPYSSEIAGLPRGVYMITLLFYTAELTPPVINIQPDPGLISHATLLWASFSAHETTSGCNLGWHQEATVDSPAPDGFEDWLHATSASWAFYIDAERGFYDFKVASAGAADIHMYATICAHSSDLVSSWVVGAPRCPRPRPGRAFRGETRRSLRIETKEPASPEYAPSSPVEAPKVEASSSSSRGEPVITTTTKPPTLKRGRLSTTKPASVK
jgi:hypothetical protein